MGERLGHGEHARGFRIGEKKVEIYKQRTRRRLAALALVAALSCGGYEGGKFLTGIFNRLVDSYYSDTVSAWQSEAAGKLEGKIPLGDTEYRYKEVEIVASGKTWEEAKAMEKNGEEVNVRDYPAGWVDVLGVFQRKTEIVEKVKPGVKIKDAVMIWGGDVLTNMPTPWVVAKCGNITSADSNMKGVSPEAVCAVHAMYVDFSPGAVKK